jgi:hypothetical protein
MKTIYTIAWTAFLFLTVVHAAQQQWHEALLYLALVTCTGDKLGRMS